MIAAFPRTEVMTEKTDAPPAPAPPAGRPPAMAPFVPDLLEHGAPVKGVPQTLDKRLFVQLHVFTGCVDTAPSSTSCARAASRRPSTPT